MWPWRRQSSCTLPSEISLQATPARCPVAPRRGRPRLCSCGPQRAWLVPAHAWAFGWQRVFLADPHGVWFTDDRATMLAGRAAALRSESPCRHPQRATESRRLRPGGRVRHYAERRSFVEITLRSDGTVPWWSMATRMGRLYCAESAERVFVDHAATTVEPRFQHAGSILLSVISQQLTRGRRG